MVVVVQEVHWYSQVEQVNCRWTWPTGQTQLVPFSTKGRLQVRQLLPVVTQEEQPMSHAIQPMLEVE